MKKYRRKSGFTLLELLIASLILSVVMLTVMTAFRTGVFGYRDIEQVLGTQRLARQVLDRLSLDLKNSVTYSDTDSGFEGEGDTMNFLALADSFENGAWRREYASLSYRWDGKKLARFYRPGKGALNAEPSIRPEETDVPAGQLSFQYGKRDPVGKGLVYVDTWEPSPQRPVAVKINFTVNAVTFERVVALPLAN